MNVSGIQILYFWDDATVADCTVGRRRNVSDEVQMIVPVMACHMSDN